MRIRIWPIVAIAGLLATGAAGAAAPGPNGLIAYSCCCPASIVAVRADGTGSRVLFRPTHDDAPLGPAWSPDGRRIAYAPGPPERGIWSMDAAGRNRRRVTAGNGGAVHPSWSPLGRRLVFADLRARESRTYDLFVVGADGRGLKRLTRTAAAEDSPAWAPNGNEIVYNRGRDLWRMRPDGSGQRLLAREAFSPAWSPGGTRIAFSRGGDPWVMARDGSPAKRVADLRSAQYDIAWSPDGRWLVTTPIDRGDVTLVRADGSETRALTRESGWFHGSPSWQRAPLRP